MLQIVMLVVGVYYAYKLATLGSAGFQFGFPPEILAQWRSHKKQQYVWGIVAGWGSLVAGLIAMVVVTAATTKCVNSYYGSYCNDGDADAAMVWMLLITAVILIGGIILSVMAGNKAKALERQAQAMGMVMPPGMQPGWGQPPAGQPVWGAPPAPQPGWGQPPAGAQPGWGTPPGAQPGWGQPPAGQPIWGTPPAGAQPPAAPAAGQDPKPGP